MAYKNGSIRISPTQDEKNGANKALPRIVVLGVGFGGLWAARTLARAPARVEVIDRNNYHTFYPLLYQVGAAELEPNEIAYPVRHTFRKMPSVNFTMGEVEHVDLENRVVHTSDQEIPYDYLIVGLGTRPNFYNIPGAEENAFALKTVDQGVALRNHILYCFERAARETGAEERQKWLSFAIVGGGPTGVEFAGALAELIHGSLRRDYPHMDMRETRVILLEAMDHLLEGFPANLGQYSHRQLEKMNIEVRLNARVVEISPELVALQDGTILNTKTVVWTAGVRGVPGASQWGLPVTRGGQVEVQPTLQVPDHPEVYVIGDLARLLENDRPLPQVAQVAIQQGRLAGQNILRQMRGEEQRPFRYFDKGMLAEIGRSSGVAYVAGRSFTGFIAWVLWLAVHIYYLIGFRNRLFVLINWAFTYFFSEQGARMIVPNEMRYPIPAQEPEVSRQPAD